MVGCAHGNGCRKYTYDLRRVLCALRDLLSQAWRAAWKGQPFARLAPMTHWRALLNSPSAHAPLRVHGVVNCAKHI